MAYVYKHVRMDTLTPYYIGIGSDSKDYKRSKEIKSRNAFWKRIHSKVETKIEIIVDNITWEEALVYEQFYIKLYGRRDKSEEGLLCNLTDGGEGVVGAIKKQSQIDATILYNKTRVLSEESRRKISESRKGQTGHGKKPVLQFDKQGNLIKEFDSLLSTKLEGFNFKQIQSILHARKKSRFHKNFRWEFKEVWDNYTEEEKQAIIEKAKEPNKTTKGRKFVTEYKKRVWKRVENPKDCRKKIEQFDLDGNFIKEYESILSSKKFGFNPKAIGECLSGKAKTHKGFIWKYKN